MVLISARLDFGVAVGRIQRAPHTADLAVISQIIAPASAFAPAEALRHRLM